MRIRNLKNTQEILKNCEFLIKNPEQYRGNFSNLFNNSNPIYLEIGMGKGNFIIQMAINHPEINFIGVEMMSSILARAIKNISNYNLPNLKVINVDAKYLDAIFSKEIATIYLNFSDPWPKTRHAKRRLTSTTFLKVYDQIFANENIIIQKTDNDLLFESSIISLTNYGYKIEDISLDLHQTTKENYLTEYENKFKNKGLKIKYLKARK